MSVEGGTRAIIAAMFANLGIALTKFVAFLITTPPGLVCLAVGCLLALAGLWWIEAIAASIEEAS